MKSHVLAGCLVMSVLSTVTLGDPPGAEPAPTVRPTQPAASKPKIYDESADAKQMIATALARAKKENRRVLVQWGGNWCPWCIRLHELFKSDAKIARVLMYEYDVVYIDAGQPADKNIDLAKGYGADLKQYGFPFLTVLDADGKAVANQETEALEVKNAAGKSAGVKEGHDPKAVLKFLEANKPAYLKAQDILDQGLAEAKASGKSVFLHFGAPWCGWCHRLEDWMARPEVASALAKDFVDVKIDEDRTIGAKEIEEKYKKSGGIPWFAFLDAQGQVIATSDGPKGNVGFPAEPHEIEHFATMLKKACKKLQPGEIDALIDSLKAKPAKG